MGKIDAIRYARENKFPSLGSASACSMPSSNLPETCATWNKPTLPLFQREISVIDLMPDQETSRKMSVTVIAEHNGRREMGSADGRQAAAPPGISQLAARLAACREH